MDSRARHALRLLRVLLACVLLGLFAPARTSSAAPIDTIVLVASAGPAGVAQRVTEADVEAERETGYARPVASLSSCSEASEACELSEPAQARAARDRVVVPRRYLRNLALLC